MRRKFYKIDTDEVTSLKRRCPVCGTPHIEEDVDEGDWQQLTCGDCESVFEYDWDADEEKGIFRYELIVS